MKGSWSNTQGIVELWNREFFLTHTHVQWEPHKVLWWSLLLKILYFRKALASQQTERKEQTSPFPFPSHIHSLSHCQHLPSFDSFVQIDKPLGHFISTQHPQFALQFTLVSDIQWVCTNRWHVSTIRASYRVASLSQTASGLPLLISHSLLMTPSKLRSFDSP